MQLKKLGPNMTELQTQDGTRILYSYETPVAAVTLERLPYAQHATVNYLKTDKFHSRTTSAHVAAWIPKGVKARIVSQDELSGLAGAK